MRKLSLIVASLLVGSGLIVAASPAEAATCKVAVANQGDGRWAFRVVPGSAQRNHKYSVKWAQGASNLTRTYGAEYSVIVRSEGNRYPVTVNAWRGNTRCASTWEG